MAEPPEFWTYLASNVLLLITGGVLTGLSFRAYMRNRHNRSFGAAMVGFGTITVGSLVEAIYELGIRGSYHLGGRELLALHTVEGVLIALGLGTLFYSLSRY